MMARTLALLVLGCFVLTGCDDDDPRPGDATGPEVNVIPREVNLPVGDTVDFDVIVDGVDTQDVAWSIVGEVQPGEIDGFGVYTAPDTIPSPATVLIQAEAFANPTNLAFAEVTIVPGIDR